MKRRQLTLEEYCNLSSTQQYDMVFDQGVFLEKRHELDREFALYAVDRFFVELEYEKEENLIIGKQAFIAGVVLDEYISLDPESLLEEE